MGKGKEYRSLVKIRMQRHAPTHCIALPPTIQTHTYSQICLRINMRLPKPRNVKFKFLKAVWHAKPTQRQTDNQHESAAKQLGIHFAVTLCRRSRSLLQAPFNQARCHFTKEVTFPRPFMRLHTGPTTKYFMPYIKRSPYLLFLIDARDKSYLFREPVTTTRYGVMRNRSGLTSLKATESYRAIIFPLK